MLKEGNRETKRLSSFPFLPLAILMKCGYYPTHQIWCVNVYACVSKLNNVINHSRLAQMNSLQK